MPTRHCPPTRPGRRTPTDERLSLARGQPVAGTPRSRSEMSPLLKTSDGPASRPSRRFHVDQADQELLLSHDQAANPLRVALDASPTSRQIHLSGSGLLLPVCPHGGSDGVGKHALGIPVLYVEGPVEGRVVGLAQRGPDVFFLRGLQGKAEQVLAGHRILLEHLKELAAP